MKKKLSAGFALAAALGAAWFATRPGPAVSATRVATVREAAESVPSSSTLRHTLRHSPVAASAQAEEVEPPLETRARDAVSRAASELRDYMDKNPSRLHEMCLRGAKPEEYEAEAARLTALLAPAAGGPIGKVVLQAPDPGCRKTYDDWVSAGLANTLFGSDAASVGVFLLLKGGDGNEDAQRALGEIVASSSDDKERLAALVIMKRSDKERVALPLGAYAGIAGKSPQEIQLLLDGHASVPLPKEAVAAVRTLVTDTEQPINVRSDALTALGHPKTSSELLAVVGQLGSDPSVTPALLADVGPAIAMCGAPCGSALEKLAASTDEQLRGLAYNAGLRAQGELQTEFRRLIQLAQASSTFQIGEDERALRASLEL